MPFNLKTHEFKVRDGKRVISRNTPHARFVNGGQGPIFLKNGKFYYEDGVELVDPPQWAVEAANALLPRAASEVGFRSRDAETIQAEEEEQMLAELEPRSELEPTKATKGRRRKPADEENLDQVATELLNADVTQTSVRETK